jgi:hypothetical protein
MKSEVVIPLEAREFPMIPVDDIVNSSRTELLRIMFLGALYVQYLRLQQLANLRVCVRTNFKWIENIFTETARDIDEILQ